jgi:hypothetical protein
MRAFLGCILLLPLLGATQNATMPRDYRGPETRVFGVFVTPVPNAAFSAHVDIISRQKLEDGTMSTRTTRADIARDSAGRIYNERRALVAATFHGEPPLLSAHIYDPATRTSVFLEPSTHLAKQIVLKQALRDGVAREAAAADTAVKEENLGTQTLGPLTIHGIRKSRVIPAQASGTGAQVTVTDEYWFSPELSMYMVIKHKDPRSGEQIVGISDVERTEPPASRFAIPAGYKLVDETPVE